MIIDAVELLILTSIVVSAFPSVELVFASTVAVGFAIGIAIITIQICKAYLGAKRSERQMIELMRQGLCPCCGKHLPEGSSNNCDHCRNWVAGYRAAFKKQIAKPN
jgi:hypothetical protein